MILPVHSYICSGLEEMIIAYTIMLSVAVFYMASDIYTPSLPILSQYFQASSDSVQATLTVYMLAATLTCAITGYLSDKYGKKKMLWIGAIIGVLGSLITLTSVSLPQMLIGRFIQGLGGSVAPVVGFAFIQEYYPPKKAMHIFSQIGLIIGILPAIAPMLGGWISTTFGWRWNFILIFLIMVFLLGLFLRFTPQDPSQKEKITLPYGWLKSHWHVLKNKNYLRYALLSPLFFAGEWFYISFLPFYTQDTLGLSATEYGLFMGIILLFYAVGSLLAGRLQKYIATDKLIFLGLVLSLFTPLGLGIIYICQLISITFLSLFLSLYFFSMGILFPTTVSASLTQFRTLKGTASALRYLLITLGGFFGAYVAQILPESTILNLIFFLVTVTISALAIFFLLSPKPHSPPPFE